MNENTKKKILGILLILPAFSLTMAVVALPIVQAVILSFTDVDTGVFSLVNYQKLFSNVHAVKNVYYTLHIVIVTVVLTIIIAYPLSLYLSFGKSRFARMMGKLYLIPRFIPGIVAVYAIMGIVRDSGALNRLFMQVGINLKPSLMYTPQGIVLANLWFNIPFAAMLISASMSGISPSLLESAQDVGASSFRIFRKIIFPLTAKSALVAAVFVFMGNIGSFTTPFLMGANAPRMLGVALYQEFSVFYNPAAAAALSTVMFLLSAAAGGVYIYSMMKEENWQK